MKYLVLAGIPLLMLWIFHRVRKGAPIIPGVNLSGMASFQDFVTEHWKNMLLPPLVTLGLVLVAQLAFPEPFEHYLARGGLAYSLVPLAFVAGLALTIPKNGLRTAAILAITIIFVIPVLWTLLWTMFGGKPQTEAEKQQEAVRSAQVERVVPSTAPEVLTRPMRVAATGCHGYSNEPILLDSRQVKLPDRCHMHFDLTRGKMRMKSGDGVIVDVGAGEKVVWPKGFKPSVIWALTPEAEIYTAFCPLERPGWNNGCVEEQPS